VYELVRLGLVPSDFGLPSGEGWSISADGYAVPPLLVGDGLELLIHQHRNALLEEERSDPTFASDSDLCPFLLTEEQRARVEAFDGPVWPAPRCPSNSAQIRAGAPHRCQSGASSLDL
jgi:hypothetical protein